MTCRVFSGVLLSVFFILYDFFGALLQQQDGNNNEKRECELGPNWLTNSKATTKHNQLTQRNFESSMSYTQ
jgi:hypothetical protein